MAYSMPVRSKTRYKVKGKLGTGVRFARLAKSLSVKGAKNPAALAAYIGRKKYGKGNFQKLATKGRRKGG